MIYQLIIATTRRLLALGAEDMEIQPIWPGTSNSTDLAGLIDTVLYDLTSVTRATLQFSDSAGNLIKLYDSAITSTAFDFGTGTSKKTILGTIVGIVRFLHKPVVAGTDFPLTAAYYQAVLTTFDPVYPAGLTWPAFQMRIP